MLAGFGFEGYNDDGGECSQRFMVLIHMCVCVDE